MPYIVFEKYLMRLLYKSNDLYRLVCMFQDSVPAGSYNDPFLSSVCVYLFIIRAVYMVYYLNPLGLKASSPAILHRVAWSSSKSNPGAIQLWLSQVH